MTTLAALVALGCSEPETEPSAPRRSRVESVAARVEDPSERFCDPRTASLAAEFVAPPALSGSGPRWLNLWASFCRPCIEELPLLRDWEARLQAEGTPLRVIFRSVDASEEALARFRERHPDAPSERLDADALSATLASLGLDDHASLPIHVLVGEDDRLLCLRTGSVSEDDYALVRALLR